MPPAARRYRDKKEPSGWALPQVGWPRGFSQDRPANLSGGHPGPDRGEREVSNRRREKAPRQVALLQVKWLKNKPLNPLEAHQRSLVAGPKEKAARSFGGQTRSVVDPRAKKRHGGGPFVERRRRDGVCEAVSEPREPSQRWCTRTQRGSKIWIVGALHDPGMGPSEEPSESPPDRVLEESCGRHPSEESC